MTQSNRYLSDFSAAKWADVIAKGAKVTLGPYKEVFHGVKAKTLPWGECLVAGGAVGACILCHWDYALIHKVSLDFLYPRGPISHLVYGLAAMTSPFWVWGIIQVGGKRRISQHLTDVLISAGLKNPLGKLPSFVFDRPLDENTRKMRLTCANLSKEKFDIAKPSLQSGLGIYIDEIRENREHRTIDIIYAHQPMDELVPAKDITSIAKLHFGVGKTRSKMILSDLRRTPHLLVAGQTNSGKSTFLRYFITTLYLNDPDMEFCLIDLKDRLEFQLFENLDRIQIIDEVPRAAAEFERFEQMLKNRAAILRANNCKDIDAFYAIPAKDRKFPPNIPGGDRLNRQIIIVDEAAEMFLASDKTSASDVQKARRALSKLARQGRSSGIHLVIATQRPDSKAVDVQVKANLVGVLSFRMLNDSSSITVLGNGRATDLPLIKGRAIWKYGAEMTEVQIPYLSPEETEKYLEPFRKELKEKEAPTEEIKSADTISQTDNSAPVEKVQNTNSSSEKIDPTL